MRVDKVMVPYVTNNRGEFTVRTEQTIAKVAADTVRQAVAEARRLGMMGNIIAVRTIKENA